MSPYRAPGLEALATLGRPSLTGLWRAGPVLLVPVAVALPWGLGPALGSLVFLVAWILGAGMVLSALDPRPSAPSSPWRQPALAGLALGLGPAVVWTIVGGPGWGARLAALIGIGLWAMSSAAARLPAAWAAFAGPAVAAAGLLSLMALGFLTGAGILYFFGPPLALVTLLAGQYAQGFTGGRARAGYETLAYLAAGFALALFAWVDLA